MRDHLDYGMLRLDGITEILRNNHQHITATITHQPADLIEMNGMSCEQGHRRLECLATRHVIIRVGNGR